jgi:hypothetical protein
MDTANHLAWGSALPVVDSRATLKTQVKPSCFQKLKEAGIMKILVTIAAMLSLSSANAQWGYGVDGLIYSDTCRSGNYIEVKPEFELVGSLCYVSGVGYGSMSRE